MLVDVLRSKTAGLLSQRNAFIGMSALLLVSNFILTCTVFLLWNKEKIVLIPPSVETPLTIDERGVSDAYLVELTEYFAGLILNLSPENAERHRTILLRNTSPDHYGVLKGDLVRRQRLFIP